MPEDPTLTEVPPAITAAVAADMAADVKGEERPKGDSPPPPGTDRPTFWQAQATKQALGVTIGLFLFIVYALVDFLFTGKFTMSADAVKVQIGFFVGSWSLAFGIHKTDADALRWK